MAIYMTAPVQPTLDFTTELSSMNLNGVQPTLADIENYGLYASLQVGSNGDPNGDPTSDIGDINGEENWANYAWDTNLDSGFDTGSAPIVFDAAANGDESLSVEDLPELGYTGAAMGDVSSVIIEAAVQIPAETSWSNITVEFWKGGSDVENISIPVGPDVNTIDTPSSPVASQIMVVVPSTPDCDQVIVAGSLRMRSPGIQYPASNAMFGNVFVMGTSGAASSVSSVSPVSSVSSAISTIPVSSS
jgi:hypothetical protein